MFDLAVWAAIRFAVLMSVARESGDTTPLTAGEWAVAFGLVVLMPAYGTLFESSRLKATPGKLLVGIEVCDANGNPLGFVAALQRNVIRSLVLSCCGGVFALSVFSGDGRGWWNQWSNTEVVEWT